MSTREERKGGVKGASWRREGGGEKRKEKRPDYAVDPFCTRMKHSERTPSVDVVSRRRKKECLFIYFVDRGKEGSGSIIRDKKDACGGGGGEALVEGEEVRCHTHRMDEKKRRYSYSNPLS